MLKVIVSLLLCFSFTNIYAMKISPNHTGQLLISPFYLAQDKIITKITLVNTRDDAAVVTKLIIRDFNISAKLKEIAIFLSPGDMWTGFLYGESNKTRIYSSDESTLKDDFNFATQASPLNVELSHGEKKSGVNNIGHIEIIGLSSLQADYSYCASDGEFTPAVDGIQCEIVQVKQGMTKDSLLKLYAYSVGIDTLKKDSKGKLIYKNVESDGGGISAIEPEKLQITGSTEVSIQSGPAFKYSMIALQPSDYKWGNIGIDINSGLPNLSKCSEILPYNCFSNYVISNPLFASSQFPELGIGLSYGTVDESLSFKGDSSDHVIAIESVFAKESIKHTYTKDKTFLITTFPTKYRHLDNTGSGVCQKFYGTSDAATPDLEKELYTSPFFWDDKGSLYYDFESFDQKENSIYKPGPEIPTPPDSQFSGGVEPETPPVPPNEQTIEPEVWITSLNYFYAFDQGWAKMNYIYKSGCGYLGVPSISYGLTIEGQNILLENTF